MKNRKSFTLMELLVVITIIAVLAAVSIPQVIGVIQRAQDAAIRMNMRVMLTEATRISILEGDLSRIHCNTGGHPDILAICETVRAHSPHPAQLRSSATTRTFWIRTPLHDGTFWRVDHTGFAGRDLADYIARWDMDEGSDQVVGDATGTNPGTRGPTTAVEPQDPTWAVGHLTFDGANDFIQVPDHLSLDITSTITIEAWVKRTGAVEQFAGVVAKENTDIGTGYGIRYGETGTPIFSARIGGAWSNLAFAEFPLNTWRHVVATYNGSLMQVFLDGSFSVYRPASGSIATNDFPLRIGRQERTTLTHFNGLIDNVRIYNRALTAEEVRVSFLRGR